MAKQLSEKEVIQRALWIESLCRKEMRRLQYNRSEYEKTVYSWVRSLYAKHKEGKLSKDFLKLIEHHSTFLYYFVIGKDPTELFNKYRNNTLEQIKTIAMQKEEEPLYNKGLLEKRVIDLADSGIYTVKDLDRALIKMHELDKSQYSEELQKQFYVTGLSLESKQRFILKESEELELSLYRLHDKTAHCIEEIRMLSDICKNNIGCSSIALDIYASMNDNSILFVYDGACARLREAISTLKASDIDFLMEHYFSGKTPEQLSTERGIEKKMYFRKLHGVFGRLTFGGVYQYICGYTENTEGEVTGTYLNKFNSKRYRAFINMFDKIKKNNSYKIGEEYSKYKKGFKLQEVIPIEDRYALKEMVHTQICTDAGLK